MKRVLVALLAISMAAGVLTGCGSKGSEKTFTVGFDAEFPPYGYRDDSGEYVGFDLDLAAEVCKRQGGAGKAAYRLGCQGYGAFFRSH